MKLAIYQPRVSYYQGGAEVVALEQAKRLAANGHKVSIVTSHADFMRILPSFMRFTSQSDVEIVNLEIPESMSWIYEMEAGQNWMRWDLESLHVGRLAIDYFSSNRFDAIICHNIFDCISVPTNQVSVVHLHGSPSQFDYHHHLLSTLPNRFIAVSKETARNWSKLPLTANKISVVTNGIDALRFRPMQVSKVYDLIYVGRLLQVKGLDTIVKALKFLKDEYAETPTLAIAGVGPYKSELQRMVSDYKLEDQVEYLGFVKDSVLPQLYSSAKVAILPSKAKEGILTTMLEAAACRMPIISTRIGGIPEFLNRKNGILIDPVDHLQLAHATRKILSDTALRRSLGEQARNDVINHWRWEDKIIELEEIYESIIRTAY